MCERESEEGETPKCTWSGDCTFVVRYGRRFCFHTQVMITTRVEGVGGGDGMEAKQNNMGSYKRRMEGKEYQCSLNVDGRRGQHGMVVGAPRCMNLQ